MEMSKKYRVSGFIKSGAVRRHACDDEAELWTVYEELSNGVNKAICDCYTRKDADLIQLKLRALESLPELSLYGGWTAAGINKYAAKLEADLHQAETRIRRLKFIRNTSMRTLRELAAEINTEDEISGIKDDVKVIITMLENSEWAEHCTKSALGNRLECLITDLVSRTTPNIGAVPIPEPLKPVTDCRAEALRLIARAADLLMAGKPQ